MTKKSSISFFWVEKNVIGGTSLPNTLGDIKLLTEKGIQHIVSTAYQEKVNILMLKSEKPIKQFKLPIEDFNVPNLTQIKEFVRYLSECINNKEPVVIHCYAGCGRTGLLLMVYLMVFKNLVFDKALQNLRAVRSCAVETKGQQDFLKSLDIEELQELCNIQS